MTPAGPRLLLSLVLGAAPMGPAGSREARLAPGDVARLVEAKGAAAAVAELFADDASWNDLLRGIATGKRDWLAAAGHLRPAADGPPSESLDMALSEALGRSAEHVLRLAADGAFDAAGACSSTGLRELDVGRTGRDVLRFVRARKKAVKKVSAPALAAVRRRCLEELERREQAAVQDAAGGS